MDAVLLILELMAVSVPYMLAGLWWWVGFWLLLSAVLAIVEIAAKVITGRTISQQFWDWRRNPATPAWKKWTILGGMIAFWIYLLAHLYI